MPQAIPAILAAIGASTAVIAIAQLVVMIGMAVYGSAQQRKAARKQRDEFNAGLQDRTVTRIATEAPHVYVYGRARVGSAIVAMFTSGSKDEYKHLVCVHAAHECDAFEEIYVYGKALGTLDADGFVTSGDYFSQRTEYATEYIYGGSTTITLAHAPVGGVNVLRAGTMPTDTGVVETVGYTLSGNTVTLDQADPNNLDTSISYNYVLDIKNVRVQKHLGGASDTVDSVLQSYVGSSVWPSTAVLRGFCYTVITLNLNQPEFQGGPPPVEVLLRGKKLYDPRTGLTQWSQNNALVLYDYLTGPVCNVSATDLPIAQYIAAANVCDEPESFGARYLFNGTITSDQGQAPVLEKIAQSMAGSIVSTTWDVTAGKYVAPVMALEQSDIVGSVAVTPGISDADLYNGVRGQYISAENTYVATDFKQFQNATYLAADGRDLWTNIDFPYTDSVQRVHNLCRIFVEDQRNAYTVRAEFSLKAWKLKVGERVTLTSDVFGWSAKIFRVTDKKFSPTSAVELTLKEDAESIWDFADAVEADSTPNSNLTDPYAIDPLTSLTCSSGADELLLASDGTIVSRILATWPEATTQAVFTQGAIEIEWQLTGSGVWQEGEAKGSDTQFYLSPVLDGGYYAVRARTVNSYLNVKSDWTYATTHQVIGKTAPPANITDLSISGAILNWTHVSDVDLNGYVFRFHYGSNRDWGTAAPLHSGVITQSPFDLVTRPGGVVTVMGKAVDTSGNESIATANIVTNLGDPPIANVVETIDFHGDGFPGTISGGSVVAGDLVADFTDSFYGADSQSAYGPDNDPAYGATSYDEMIYTTGDVAVSSALAGSVMTLVMETLGIDLYIEYRLSGPGSAYGPDSDSAYGADADSFYDGPGSWIPWPGQIVAQNDVYQFSITLGAGQTQGQINALSLVIDAPDIVEYLEDVAISAAGTVVPYTSNFASIKTVTTTLQANSSGAITIETNKTINLAPTLKAYNVSHVAVSGATADIIVKGY